MEKHATFLSRRTFLTGAALTGAAMAVAGVTGCASAPSNDGKQSQTAQSPAAGNQPSGSDDLAIAAVSVGEAGEPAKECDYLVIGGGNCGMMSAAHASSLGLKTILLEKSTVTGGSSVGTEVTMAFSDCKIMQECADDPNVVNASQQTGSNNDIYTYFMMHNSWEANAELVSNYVKNNHRQHDFLYEHGAYPMMLLPSLDAPTGGIMYEGQGIGAFDVMQKAAEQYDAEILTGSPATALVVDEGGTVVGAMATIDGSNAYVKAKAVFVGTGGFSTNAEMIERFIPGYGPIAWKNDSHLAHDGDGIRMMLGAGAVPSDMGFAQPSASSVEGVTWDTPIDKAAREPYLWVNAVGKRLGNEKWSVMDTMFKVGIKENDYVYFNVIDSAAVKRMETEPLMTNARTVLGSMDPVPEMGEELEKGVTSGDVYKGETIEELAEAAGIDPEGLAATVDAYNALAKAGEDTEFYKDPAALFALEEGPFYAFKLIPSWYSTLCGVKIDGKIEVVNAEGKPIPGLYAGGLDSGEFFKDNYNHGFSGGCSGYSYFTGFFAADQAKEYIDSL
ncbi:FAD-dependent oxidoreductase [Raoultibacter phocaeensis]|uniref:FAD-dependent oxidoreductase n=1 Tax=Raoultibacter phocaeensis TaxID=2479841 RepID=UPI0015D58C46|nr:FAD-dependent oxidoreductase [Raoultibacter phocaeensis]